MGTEGWKGEGREEGRAPVVESRPFGTGVPSTAMRKTEWRTPGNQPMQPASTMSHCQ
jgi:hypothetical protein